MLDQKKTGAFITKLRKELNMTQEQLAEKLSVSNRSVSRWENGNSMPDLSLLQILSEELGVTMTEILNGERLEKSDSLNESIELILEFSKQENERKAKRLNRYFLAGLLCFLPVILKNSLHILSFIENPALESAILIVLAIAGFLFEITGFYCNLKTKAFTPREVEVISNTDGDVHMKTAGEMLQFARKYQKAELKQYQLAFQKIAECLENDETVSFSMVGDSYTIKDTPGPWHICLAVTQYRLILCGEKIRGRMMTRYDIDSIPRKNIQSAELISKKIVLNTTEGIIKLEGTNLENRIEDLKKILISN